MFVVAVECGKLCFQQHVLKRAQSERAASKTFPVPLQEHHGSQMKYSNLGVVPKFQVQRIQNLMFYRRL